MQPIEWDLNSPLWTPEFHTSKFGPPEAETDWLVGWLVDSKWKVFVFFLGGKNNYQRFPTSQTDRGSEMIVTSSPTWTMPRSSWPWTVGRCVWHVFLFFLEKNGGWWMWKDVGDDEIWSTFFLKSSIKLGGVFLMRKMLFFHTIWHPWHFFPSEASLWIKRSAISSDVPSFFLPMAVSYSLFEGLFRWVIHFMASKDRDISGILKIHIVGAMKRTTYL